MTNRCDFMKYNRLKAQVEKELKDTMDSERYTKLRELHRRCFPTKEQVIEEVQAFYTEETQTPATKVIK